MEVELEAGAEMEAVVEPVAVALVEITGAVLEVGIVAAAAELVVVGAIVEGATVEVVEARAGAAAEARGTVAAVAVGVELGTAVEMERQVMVAREAGVEAAPGTEPRMVETNSLLLLHHHRETTITATRQTRLQATPYLKHRSPLHRQARVVTARTHRSQGLVEVERNLAPRKAQVEAPTLPFHRPQNLRAP